ncbi:MAG: TMEM175 family protein [Chloroflexota bacterium]|nr:TMEM175 family protein [Chloroflexota bacterium]
MGERWGMTERPPRPSEPAPPADLPVREGVDYAARRGHDTGRLLAFSAGVFAIALTLLARNIRLPSLDHGSAEAQMWAILSRASRCSSPSRASSS